MSLPASDGSAQFPEKLATPILAVGDGVNPESHAFWSSQSIGPFFNPCLENRKVKLSEFKQSVLERKPTSTLKIIFRRDVCFRIWAELQKRKMRILLIFVLMPAIVYADDHLNFRKAIQHTKSLMCTNFAFMISKEIHSAFIPSASDIFHKLSELTPRVQISNIPVAHCSLNFMCIPRISAKGSRKGWQLNVEPKALSTQAPDSSSPDPAELFLQEQRIKYESALIETFGRKEDRSKVSLQERPIDVKRIADLFVKKKLNLTPKYQRGFVWTSARASRLIETVLGRRFVPPIVLHEREGGRYDVVDGKQRLLSLLSFYFGSKAESLGLPAEAVELKLEQPDGEASPLNGLRFEYLSADDQDVYGMYLLNSRVIPENADQDLVFAIYQDINSGGQEHTDHQLRRAAYQSEYFELIDSLRSNPHFLRIRNATEVDDARELDGEMILRAFAFGNREFRAPLFKFLNREAAAFNRQLLDASPRGAEELLARRRREFEEVVRVMLDVFGPEAVCRRRWDTRRQRWESKPSLPLWDSLYNVLRELLLVTRTVSAVALQQRADSVRHALREKLESGELDKVRARCRVARPFPPLLLSPLLAFASPVPVAAIVDR